MSTMLQQRRRNMQEPVYTGTEDDEGLALAEPIERDKDGRFVVGNTASVGQSRATGVVAYIKDITNGATEMIDLLLCVMRGDEETAGFMIKADQRIDCAKELLDRSIGKPVQTVVETGDDTSKEVLRMMQESLKQSTEPKEPKDEPIAPDSNVSPIESMKKQRDG